VRNEWFKKKEPIKAVPKFNRNADVHKKKKKKKSRPPEHPMTTPGQERVLRNETPDLSRKKKKKEKNLHSKYPHQRRTQKTPENSTSRRKATAQKQNGPTIEKSPPIQPPNRPSPDPFEVWEKAKKRKKKNTSETDKQNDPANQKDPRCERNNQAEKREQQKRGERGQLQK